MTDELITDYLRRKAKSVEPEFDIVEAHRLTEAADRIEAQAAEIETLKTMIFATGEAAATNLRTAMERAAEIDRLRAVVNDLLTRFDAWSPHDHDAVKNAKKALGETE